MSDTADEMAEALGAFKMQLDARRDPPVRETGFYGVVVRESEFPAQLPEPPRAIPQPQLLPPMCQGYGAGPIRVTFSGVQNAGNPPDDPPGSSALNGTWILNFVESGQAFCSWAFIEGDAESFVGISVGFDFDNSQWDIEATCSNSGSPSFTEFDASGQFGDPMPNADSVFGGTGTISY